MAVRAIVMPKQSVGNMQIQRILTAQSMSAAVNGDIVGPQKTFADLDVSLTVRVEAVEVRGLCILVIHLG